MDITNLKSIISDRIKPGMVYKNPKKGTSTVCKVTEEGITYIRGSSRMKLPVSEFIAVYKLFAGKKCTTKNIREYNPKVFDSKQNGHDCNCTFLFSIAIELGLVEGSINGKGVSGDLYFVIFK